MNEDTAHHLLPSMIRRIVVVALVVFCTAEIGILTRPIGFFATLWPANAVLLGLFVIRPSLAGPWGWVAAVLAYLAAGHVSGDAPLLNLWLTAANLAGIVAGFILLRRLDAEDRALQRPSSVLRMLLVCIVAAVAAAIAGCGLVLLVPNSLPRVGFAYWFTTELANYVVILPVLLTLPEIPARGVMLDRLARFRPSLATIMPVVALGLSVVGSIVIGGPGAIAFPVPALLWCSLTYGLFPVTLLVLLSSLAMLGAETADLFRFVHVEDLIDSATSFRLGLTLLALGPLTVATITAVHRKLM
ncbi:MAG: sensor domain-containing diguanylate cyclase, partial [Rhizobiales bacterium]|nr:sensor domain-containing diguanylate cyclase [Hyphomicrobiales bacterium]